jgi:hypothetical protein
MILGMDDGNALVMEGTVAAAIIPDRMDLSLLHSFKLLKG